MATFTITETLHTAEEIPLSVLSPKAVLKGSHDSDKPFVDAPILEPAIASDDSAAPEDAFEAKVKWNSPPINRYRVLATFWAFFVLGMNDGSYGVSRLKPQLLYALTHSTC